MAADLVRAISGAAITLAACVATASTASAEESATTLGWSAEPGCIARDEFVRALAAATEAEIAPAPVGAPATLRIAITRRTDPPRFAAAVELGPPDDARRRELDTAGDDCRRIDDALVVVASVLLLDEAARARSGTRPTAIHAPPTRTTALSVAMRVLGRARVDVLPGVAGGLGLEAEVGLDALSIHLGAWGWLPVEARVLGAGGRFAAFTGELGACLRAGVIPELELGGCASVGIGVVHSSGIGLDASTSTSTLHVELGARAVARVPLAEAVSVWLAAGVAIPLVRPRYFFDDGEASLPVFQAAPIAPDGALGIELRAP
jgi:hypothetical protein